MTKDDIMRWAREAGGLPDPMVFYAGYERFANLVAAHKAEVALAEAYRCGYEAGAVAERERIIAKNVPEIEKINTHIKALEEAVLAEREAWAKLCESHVRYPSRLHFADTIRTRTTT